MEKIYLIMKEKKVVCGHGDSITERMLETYYNGEDYVFYPAFADKQKAIDFLMKHDSYIRNPEKYIFEFEITK